MKLLRTPHTRLALLIFLFVRGSLLLALPYEGLLGYGDMLHFFRLASLPGWPYLQSWAEFPPLFPFLSELAYRLTGGVEHSYTYLLVLILSAADLGSVLLAARLAQRSDASSTGWRSALFAALLAGLPYAWWYFDSLAVFFGLLALELAFSRRPAVWSGLALGLGILTKFFPALWLPALWHWLPRRRAAVLTASALLFSLAVYGGLWAASPAFTRAALQSQSAKGSWETVWALLDGNHATGNFGPESERLDPTTAVQPMGNPARISPWLSLAAFGLLGLAFFRRYLPATPGHVLAFAGFTWSLFLLWSPGWSPQWLLYLLPLILLVLPQPRAALLAGLLVLVNLLEWPLLLSRGQFQTLPATILLRSALLVLLAILWWQAAREAPDAPAQPASGA